MEDFERADCAGNCFDRGSSSIFRQCFIGGGVIRLFFFLNFFCRERNAGCQGDGSGYVMDCFSVSSEFNCIIGCFNICCVKDLRKLCFNLCLLILSGHNLRCGELCIFRDVSDDGNHTAAVSLDHGRSNRLYICKRYNELFFCCGNSKGNSFKIVFCCKAEIPFLRNSG